MSDWTKEPWRTGKAHPSRILGPMGSNVVVANTALPDDEDNPSDLEKSNAARIVSCVNALAGFPDPEADVRALVGALKMCHDCLAGRNLGIPARSVQSIANAALARLRREP